VFDDNHGAGKMKDRKRQIFNIKRKRRARKVLARELGYIASSIFFNKLLIDSIIRKIDLRIETKAREASRVHKILEENKHRSDILKPYASYWLGSSCKPVLGGMPPRLVTKVSYEGPKKILILPDCVGN